MTLGLVSTNEYNSVTDIVRVTEGQITFDICGILSTIMV